MALSISCRLAPKPCFVGGKVWEDELEDSSVFDDFFGEFTATKPHPHARFVANACTRTLVPFIHPCTNALPSEVRVVDRQTSDSMTAIMLRGRSS